MGDLLGAMGAGEQAREYYKKDLEITERLAKQEPDRADYQTDLVVSLYRAAAINPENIISVLERALAILHDLDSEGRLEPAKRDWIIMLEKKIRNLGKKSSKNIFQAVLTAFTKPWSKKG
jgi:energy-converting hydrogenase A subunit M